MHYSQSPPLNDQYYERDVEASDPAGEGPSDRVRSAQTRYDPSLRLQERSNREQQAIDCPANISRLCSLFIAVVLGVGATLGWQSYGDEAKEMVRAWDPSLDWLLPASVTKPPGPVTATEVEQQLNPMALDVALLRRSVEQFAANLDQLARKEEQMAQNIAAMQATEQQLIQKVSSPAPSKPVHVPLPSQPSQ